MELTEYLQDDPKPARPVVIIKLKEDMSKKARLVVDMLRNGTNGRIWLCQIRECGTRLDRWWTSWNTDSLHMKPGGTCGHLPKRKAPDTSLFFVVDFKDAFCTLHTLREEWPFVVVRGLTRCVVLL